MPAFTQYRWSNPKSKQHVKHTFMAALLPFGIVLLFMIGQGKAPEAWLWGALGIVIGTTLIYAGAYELRKPDPGRTTWARYLAGKLKQGFPYLTFIVQTIYLAVVVFSIWTFVTFLAPGFPWWIHLHVYLLLLMIPFLRWAHTQSEHTDSPAPSKLFMVSSYLMAIFLTTLTCSAFTYGFLPKTHLSSEEVNPILIVVWIISILVVFVLILLLADSLKTKKKKDGE